MSYWLLLCLTRAKPDHSSTIIQGSEFRVFDTVFASLDSKEESGGAISINKTDVTGSIKMCRFEKCSSDASGGAIFVMFASVKIQNVCAESCSAGSKGSGNFLYLRESKDIGFVDCGISVTLCSDKGDDSITDGTLYYSMTSKAVKTLNTTSNHVGRWGCSSVASGADWFSLSYVNAVNNSAGDSIVTFFYSILTAKAIFLNIVNNSIDEDVFSVVWNNDAGHFKTNLVFGHSVLLNNPGCKFIFSAGRMAAIYVHHTYVEMDIDQELIGQSITHKDLYTGSFATLPMVDVIIEIKDKTCHLAGQHPFTSNFTAFPDSSLAFSAIIIISSLLSAS